MPDCNLAKARAKECTLIFFPSLCTPLLLVVAFCFDQNHLVVSLTVTQLEYNRIGLVRLERLAQHGTPMARRLEPNQKEETLRAHITECRKKNRVCMNKKSVPTMVRRK